MVRLALLNLIDVLRKREVDDRSSNRECLEEQEESPEMALDEVRAWEAQHEFTRVVHPKLGYKFHLII